MNVTHQPATPLPFSVEKVRVANGMWDRYSVGRAEFYGTICGAGSICTADHVHKTAWGKTNVLYTPEEALRDAKYYAHAANAYPKFVEDSKAILATLGNVDHSKGNGANAAKMRGELLNAIRSTLGQRLGNLGETT